MRIGEAAVRSGVSAKTIRYYESIGLIRRPPRGDNAYRAFDEADVQILRFIQRARSFDFSLEDVAELLSLWRNPGRSAREVRELAMKHLERLEQRRLELQGLEDSIRDLVEKCGGGERPECPILEVLDEDGAAEE